MILSPTNTGGEMAATFFTASALIRLLDRRDPDHHASRGLFSMELECGSALVTTNYAVLLASLELQRHHGVAGPQALAELLLPAMRVEWVTRRDHDLGLAAVLAAGQPAHGDSVVDLGVRVDQQVAKRLGANVF
jgi:hypothetical protein